MMYGQMTSAWITSRKIVSISSSGPLEGSAWIVLSLVNRVTSIFGVNLPSSTPAVG
jgi:hypothetical protein